MHADLQPDLLLNAYANGIFPMADEEELVALPTDVHV